MMRNHDIITIEVDAPCEAPSAYMLLGDVGGIKVRVPVEISVEGEWCKTLIKAVYNQHAVFRV